VETPRPTGRRTRRSASFISTVTFGGRVLERAGAFGQILLIAAFFGATTQSDLYFVASIVPLTFGSIMGEALYASVLPSLAHRPEHEIDDIACAGFWISTVLLVGTTLAYAAVLAVVVPMASPAGSESLGPWLAFAPIGIFLGLGGYLSAVLLRLEHYFWPPFRSAASTIIGLGLSALALVLTDNLVWVAVAVSTGFGVALLLLALELTHAVGGGPFMVPTRTALYAVIGMRGKFTTSVTGGILGGQVFVFLERALAASLGVGAVTAISYARGVAFTPTIVAGSIALGVYPGMLRAHAAGDARMLRSTFLAGLRSILFVAVCTAAYVALYAESVTGLLFGHGKLNPDAQHEVSRALAAFSVAVVGTMLMIITARVFGAIDRFHGIVVSQGIALALYVPLALALRPGLGPAGLALAFGVAELTGATYAVLRCARYVDTSVRELLRTVVVPACGRATAVVVLLAAVHYGLDPRSNLVEAIGGLAAGILAAGAVLWWSSWAELDGMRKFVRGLLPH
jgi:putative peptidoglycan lipid II flippase